MRVAELDLLDGARKFLRTIGYDELYPPQADSVDAGLLDGTNILVSAPTASGKTLIALLGILGCISRSDQKAVYLSPLRALASEKYAEFKKLEEFKIKDKKIRVDITTGDYEMSRKDFELADIIIMTNERMDSLIRRRPAWITRVGLVISDEIHLLGDVNRGPALEMTLSHLKSMEHSPQILGLSATVSNAAEIASWLDAELVTSGWRPVPLHEGIYDGDTLHMDNGDEREIDTSVRGPAIDLGLDCIVGGGQSLVFANTRANSVSLATKASVAVKNIMKHKNEKRLDAASKKIIKENEHTDMVKKLADLVTYGVAFHHAGLSQSCRNIVESEFREGAIRLIATTPTLAAGVNLPARRIIIPTISRYDVRAGHMAPISVLEYKQMSGRAGRPQYDDYGESIIVASSGGAEIARRYIGAMPEPIDSRMTDARAMRVHTLGLLVMRPPITRDDLVDFFMQTLAGTQTDSEHMQHEVGAALRFLVKEGLVTSKKSTKTTKYTASTFGEIVSTLYLDPETAIEFRNLVDTASSKRDHTLGLICAITACGEFYPKFSPRERDIPIAEQILEKHYDELFFDVSANDLDRAPLTLCEWVTETTESRIAINLGVESGDLRRMTERAAWLTYCLATIARHAKRHELTREANMLQYRISYGVRTELVELVRLRGIGRVRSRNLYRAGFRNRKSLQDATLDEIAGVNTLTRRLATSIKSQLNTGRRT